MSILTNLVLFALAARADVDQAERRHPTIVLLSIEDGYLVSAKAAAKLERLLAKCNRRARIVTIRESGGEWASRIEREIFSTPEDRSSVYDVINDISSAEDSVAARVRTSLTERLANVTGPIDQLVVFAPILGGGSDAAVAFHILGWGEMNERGFDPKVALALAPLRRRLSKTASIVFLGGHVLGDDASADETIGHRVLDFFGASEGRFFGLRPSKDEAQSIKLRPSLSPLRLVAVGGLAGAATSLGLWADVISLPWVVLATVATPFNLNAVLVGVDFWKKMPVYRRQTRFGLEFKGARIDRRAGVRPLEFGRDEREIFSCGDILDTVRDAGVIRSREF